MGSANRTNRKTQIQNPTLPSTDPCLNLSKNAVWRNYFPFAVVSRAGDFFPISIAINLLVSINDFGDA
jgi:hypothetical protein